MGGQGIVRGGINLSVACSYNPSIRKGGDNVHTIIEAKANRTREWRVWRAVIVALVAAVVAAILASVGVTMWNKPRVWVPVLAGYAVGVITYALIAPES